MGVWDWYIQTIIYKMCKHQGLSVLSYDKHNGEEYKTEYKDIVDYILGNTDGDFVDIILKKCVSSYL